MMRFGGYEICVHPLLDHEVPKIQMSDDVPCTTEVRNMINAWLLETFGSRLPCYQTQGTIFLGQKLYDRLLKAAAQ